jgi:hypothetical protein
MILVDVGLVLPYAGLMSARAVPAWAPWRAVGLTAADFAALRFTGLRPTWPVTVVWGFLTVGLAYIRVRFLAMPTTWAGYGSVATDVAPPLPVAG